MEKVAKKIREATYRQKELESEKYWQQEDEFHFWLKQKILPQNTQSIM